MTNENSVPPDLDSDSTKPESESINNKQSINTNHPNMKITSDEMCSGGLTSVNSNEYMSSNGNCTNGNINSNHSNTGSAQRMCLSVPRGCEQVRMDLVQDGVVQLAVDMRSSTSDDGSGANVAADRCVVELHPRMIGHVQARDQQQQSVTSNELARLLAYIHFAHNKFCQSNVSANKSYSTSSSNIRSPLSASARPSTALCLVVDCRRVGTNTPDIVYTLLGKSLAKLMNWLPECISSIFWVDSSSGNSATSSIALEDEEDDDATVCYTREYSTQLAMNALLSTMMNHGDMSTNTHAPLLHHDKMRTVDLSALHEELPQVQMSDALQEQCSAEPAIDTHQYNAQWTAFRQNVEQLFTACNWVTRAYVELYSDLNTFAAVDTWEVQLAHVQDIIISVNDRLLEIEQSAQFNIVRSEGADRIQHLETQYPALVAAQQNSYLRVLEKARQVHGSMRHIMDKAAANVNNRCTHLHTVLTARQFMIDATELIDWCENTARPRAKAAMNETSVTLVRLRVQEQKYDEFFVAAKQKISDGEELLLKHEYLCVDTDADDNVAGTAQDTPKDKRVKATQLIDDTPGSPAPAMPVLLKQVTFSASQCALLTRTWKQLMTELESTVHLLYTARDTLADSLIAYHMLDKVYDWALNNAKWSSQLSMLISAAVENTNYQMDSISKLQTKVQQQLSTYPHTELKQLPALAARVPDSAKMSAQVQSLTDRCKAARESLQSNERSLQDIVARKLPDMSTDDEVFCDAPTHLAPRAGTSSALTQPLMKTPARDRSPSADTEYEHPISAQPISITLTQASPQNTDEDGNERTVQVQEPVVCWRRRSYAGPSPPTHSYSSSKCSSVSASGRPLSIHMRHSVSNQSTVMHSTVLEELHSDEEHVNMAMCITDDMTDQVCTNMSKQTLRRRQDERRQPSSHKHSQSVSSIGGLLTSHQCTTSIGLMHNTSTGPPSAPLDRRSRAGSARFALVQKVKKPFRKLMKRSSTMDELNSVCDEQDLQEQVNALVGHTANTDGQVDTGSEHNSPLHRHHSVHSLLSIDEPDECSASPASSSSTHCLSTPMTNGSDSQTTEHQQLDDTQTNQSPSASHNDIEHTPASAMRMPVSVSSQSLPCTPSTASPDQRMQCNVLKELIMTEQAYVHSLQYVVQNYIPEMSRTDLPSEMRCKKYTIFGNIEKICEFHSMDFLPSLQACISTNNDMDSLCVEVARCFMEHREQWHLYALYNKNKCCSEVSMSEAGSTFFRTRQLLLQDPLDLSSYLLKPVQRMGKYSLLLKQLLKTIQDCEVNKETRDMLMQAELLVTFQLRHGNDLLAMDLIRQCDVTLAEQGELLRQDEFSVYEHGRRGVHTRRVFLFEHLVLFAKPKPQRTLNSKPTSYAARLLADTYTYKGCIKTSDLGMTEDVHNDPRKFGLWFRRVNGPGPNYVLQASNENIRKEWLHDISELLWKQSHRNREIRKKETLNMGIGDRASCLNLQSSVDRIQDRSVSISASQLHKVTRFREQCQSVSSDRAVSSATPAGASRSSSSSGNMSLCSSEQSLLMMAKRPHSLISTGTNSSASSAGSQHGVLRANNTPRSIESGICADLSTLHEMPLDLDQQSSDSRKSDLSHKPVLLDHDSNSVHI